MDKKIIGILFCVLMITSVFPVVSSIDTGIINNLSNKVNINKTCGCDTEY